MRTLSSPAQNMNLASGFWYRMRFTISPLLTAIGLTSRFFLPTSTVRKKGSVPPNYPCTLDACLQSVVCAPSCSPTSLGIVGTGIDCA